MQGVDCTPVQCEAAEITLDWLERAEERDRGNTLLATLFPTSEVNPVAGKRPQQRADTASDERAEAGPAADQAQCDNGEPSDLEAAEETLRQAKERLKEARQTYWQLRRQTVEQLKQVREMSVGEAFDCVLKQVKRYPGPSVIVALLAGLFLGRLFRR